MNMRDVMIAAATVNGFNHAKWARWMHGSVPFSISFAACIPILRREWPWVVHSYHTTGCGFHTKVGLIIKGAQRVSGSWALENPSTRILSRMSLQKSLHSLNLLSGLAASCIWHSMTVSCPGRSSRFMDHLHVHKTVALVTANPHILVNFAGNMYSGRMRPISLTMHSLSSRFIFSACLLVEEGSDIYYFWSYTN